MIFVPIGEPAIKALPQRDNAEAPQDGSGLDLKVTSRYSSQPRGSIAPYSSPNLRHVRAPSTDIEQGYTVKVETH